MKNHLLNFETNIMTAAENRESLLFSGRVVCRSNESIFGAYRDTIDLDRCHIKLSGYNVSIGNQKFISIHPLGELLECYVIIESYSHDDILGSVKVRPIKNIKEKPPIGLKPLKIWEDGCNQDRIDEIIDAMTRYSEVEKPIPLEWISELYGRIKRNGV